MADENAKPEEAEDEAPAMKTYIVTNGSIMDSTGKKCRMGEPAELTKPVADALLKSGAVMTEAAAKKAAKEAEEAAAEEGGDESNEAA